MSRLETMGYQILQGFAGAPQQRFLHVSNAIQLFVFESGSGEWFDTILIDDYLWHNHKACDELSLKKKDLIMEKSVLFAELLPDAQQWWIEYYNFSPVEMVAGELKDAQFEWYVCGGWALDLYLGSVERVHHDVDVIMPRRSQLELQNHLAERGWRLLTPYEKRLEPWPSHMRLEGPRHRVHAYRDGRSLIFCLPIWMMCGIIVVRQQYCAPGKR